MRRPRACPRSISSSQVPAYADPTAAAAPRHGASARAARAADARGVPCCRAGTERRRERHRRERRRDSREHVDDRLEGTRIGETNVSRTPRCCHFHRAVRATGTRAHRHGVRYKSTTPRGGPCARRVRRRAVFARAPATGGVGPFTALRSPLPGLVPRPPPRPRGRGAVRCGAPAACPPVITGRARGPRWPGGGGGARISGAAGSRRGGARQGARRSEQRGGFPARSRTRSRPCPRVCTSIPGADSARVHGRARRGLAAHGARQACVLRARRRRRRAARRVPERPPRERLEFRTQSRRGTVTRQPSLRGDKGGRARFRRDGVPGAPSGVPGPHVGRSR